MPNTQAQTTIPVNFPSPEQLPTIIMPKSQDDFKPDVHPGSVSITKLVGRVRRPCRHCGTSPSSFAIVASSALSAVMDDLRSASIFLLLSSICF